MSDDRLPTQLWVDAHLRVLNEQGKFYYILNTGDPHSGIVIIKINGLDKGCHVLIQQRNLDGEMGWADALNKERVDESEADAYIRRSIERDPDLWVIEVEDSELKNPFDGTKI